MYECSFYYILRLWLLYTYVVSLPTFDYICALSNLRKLNHWVDDSLPLWDGVLKHHPGTFIGAGASWASKLEEAQSDRLSGSLRTLLFNLLICWYVPISFPSLTYHYDLMPYWLNTWMTRIAYALVTPGIPGIEFVLDPWGFGALQRWYQSRW